MTTPRDAAPAPDPIDISISPVWTIRHHGQRQFDLLPWAHFQEHG
jgi:hypothetical protein